MFALAAVLLASLSTSAFAAPLNAAQTTPQGAARSVANPALLALARSVEADLRALREQPGELPLDIEVITETELICRNAEGSGSGGVGIMDVVGLLLGVTSPASFGERRSDTNDLRLGFYDPDTRVMTVVDRPGMELGSLKLREVLAHELTHALDDEELGFQGLWEQVTTIDQAFALRAVMEGSATVVSELYMEGWKTSQADVASSRQHQSRREGRRWARFSRTHRPEPFDEGLAIFPYVHGARFLMGAAALADVSLRDAVLQAGRDLPQSTEQILHPSRYWLERDAPVTRSAEALSPVLDALGLSMMESTTVGELATSLAISGDRFEAESASDWLNPAATGWGGDTFMVLGPEESGRWSGQALWYTTWDSAEDRDEFALAVRHIGIPVPSWTIVHGARVAVVTFGLSPAEVAIARQALDRLEEQENVPESRAVSAR